MMDYERLANVTHQIGLSLFPRGWILDTFAWGDESGDAHVAWFMEPVRMEKMLGAEGRMPFRGPNVARALKALGVPYQNFEYEREMVAADFIARFQDALAGAMSEDYDPVSFTFIPRPGYPWPTGDDVYYSAKASRWLDSPRPEWLLPERVVDAGRAIDSYGVDLCALLPVVESPEGGPLVGRYGDGPDDFFIVSHAMGTIEGMTRFGSWEENRTWVEQCGGLLFPSLAVGAVAPANFGVCVFVADIDLIVGALKPNRRRGQQQMVDVYDTDAWTGRTREFVVDGSVSAFEQLHGHSDYMYYYDQNVWPLGPPHAPELLGGPTEASTLDTERQLVRELKARARIWKRELTPEQLEKLGPEIGRTKARYPYLEAKLRGVMPIDEFPMVAVPEQAAEPFMEGFLDPLGFTGELVRIELPDEVAEVMGSEWNPSADVSIERRYAIQAWAWQQYGWHVADAVRERARERLL